MEAQRYPADFDGIVAIAPWVKPLEEAPDLRLGGTAGLRALRRTRYSDPVRPRCA